MSSIATTYDDAVKEAQRLARIALRPMEAAYQAVFDGTPTRDDQMMVLRDLEDFCGMRTPILRTTFHETGQAAGMMLVWQHIHRLRFPRPETVSEQEQSHGEVGRPAPTKGGGVSQPTLD